MQTLAPDMEALKTRLKATWMAGDYGRFAKYLEPDALEFLARQLVAPGTRMLDVACGAGQLAIPAARTGVHAFGVDIADNLIDQARARAAAEGLDARFDVGDAESLPYEDASFDMVVSLFGMMFAPQPNLVAVELLRVCRPGGRIVLGNWTPEGHVGQMFKTIGKHVPPSPLMAPPVQWGNEALVRERLGHGLTRLEMSKRDYVFRYPFGPAKVVEFFIELYGPTNRAIAALDASGQQALRTDLVTLWTSNNRATDGSTVVHSEFLEVVGVRG